MAGSPPQTNDPAHAEASSSHSLARQPAVEDVDDDNDEELLATDPLNGDLAAGYAPNVLTFGVVLIHCS